MVVDEEKINHQKAKEGCYVIGVNTDPEKLSTQEVTEIYDITTDMI